MTRANGGRMPASNRGRGGSDVLRDKPGVLSLADEWGRAARDETNPIRRAIAVAAHSAALRAMQRERGRAER